ncbi:hypothetical protein DFP72DRAFT_1047308 [Ephemerocybe angulata]|uniref:Uncharacterized protein n=1 Tax=Ephemerocybe angulata TaxID=980116 RepID=A0A8H6HS88_9AGAR|nr:hypothetical protein DFP72DRAFT_1047308 [Tulosesus angulatus]
MARPALRSPPSPPSSCKNKLHLALVARLRHLRHPRTPDLQFRETSLRHPPTSNDVKYTFTSTHFVILGPSVFAIHLPQETRAGTSFKTLACRRFFIVRQTIHNVLPIEKSGSRIISLHYRHRCVHPRLLPVSTESLPRFQNRRHHQPLLKRRPDPAISLAGCLLAAPCPLQPGPTRPSIFGKREPCFDMARMIGVANATT